MTVFHSILTSGTIFGRKIPKLATCQINIWDCGLKTKTRATYLGYKTKLWELIFFHISCPFILSFVVFRYLHDYKLCNLNSECEIWHWNLYSMKFYEQWHHIQSQSSIMLDWQESVVERGTVAKLWCWWGIRVYTNMDLYNVTKNKEYAEYIVYFCSLLFVLVYSCLTFTGIFMKIKQEQE